LEQELEEEILYKEQENELEVILYQEEE